MQQLLYYLQCGLLNMLVAGNTYKLSSWLKLWLLIY